MEDFETLANTLKEVIEYQKHLAEEITEIKTSIMTNLIEPIENEYKQMQHDNALSDWRCKYGEKLEPFADKLKSIEGDDFDIIEKSFDDFNERDDLLTADEYVDALVSKVNEQLDVIGKAFGVEPEEVKEVTVETKDGEETKAEVENGEVAAVEKETETPSTETNTEAETENTDVEKAEKADVDVEAEAEKIAPEPEPEQEAEPEINWEEELKKVGGKAKADFLRV